MEELIFLVEESYEGGYIAKALGVSIVTEANTYEELRSMVKDAVHCHYETEADRPKMIRLHFVKDEVFAAWGYQRDVDARELIGKLKQCGYEISRQTGSHIRLTTNENGEHHITVPNHNPLKIGTFVAILDGVAEHFALSRQELLSRLFF